MARYLGIDITPTSLRGTLVKSALRKAEVERYIEIPLTALPHDPARGPELADAGASLLRALDLKPDAITAAMPGELVSLRTLELPATARKRLSAIIPFELEAVLPFEATDAVIGFQTVVAPNGALHVLAAAVQHKHVVAEIEKLRAAGLDPTELAAGASAFDGLVHLLPALEAKGPTLIVDVEPERTEVCVLEGGRSVAGRTLTVGLSHLHDTSAELERELQRTIAAFQANGMAPIAAAYVSGSCAHAAGIIPWLTGVLEIEPKLLPLPELVGASPTAASQVNLGFARATALAARGIVARQRIDLRTGDLAATHGKVRLADHASLAVICVVAVLLSAVFSLKAQQSLLVEEQDALRGQLRSVTKDLFGEEMDDSAAVRTRIENPKSSDPLPRFDAFDALAAISASIPYELKHEMKRVRIDVAQEKKEGRLEMQGALESLGGRDTIVSLLESQGCFRDIQLGRTSPVPGQDLINYQLEAKVQCPGEGPLEKKKKTGGDSSSDSKSNATEEP